MQGLCHISELSSGWLAKADDVRKHYELVSFDLNPHPPSAVAEDELNLRYGGQQI